jgi:phosphatidate cytidylyltransferase
MTEIPMTIAQPATLQLFGGVAGVLLLASAVGAVLKHAVARGQPHAVIDNLVQRVNAWWVMVGAIGVAFAFGPSGVVLLFAGISAFALREFTAVLDTREADRPAIAVAFCVALPLQYAAVWAGWYSVYSVLVPLLAFLALPIAGVLGGLFGGGDTQRYLERTSRLQWGLVICVFCASHVPALATLHMPGPAGNPLLLIAFLVIVVQGSDVLQYIWGKLLGRRKVAPVLSPSKTWEGLVGGVASATALGAALHWITPFTPLQAAGLSFLLCAMGFLGGLVMSAIKRDRGVKDWGELIRGHGGMLDRLDSLVFAAPVFFHVVRWHATAQAGG